VPVETVGSFVSFDTWVKGTFLNEGENAGKVLLVERDMQQLDVRLVDPENVEASTVLARLEGNRYLSYVAEKLGSSELLIHGWAIEGTEPVDFAETTRLLFIRLTPGEEASILYLPPIDFGYLRSFGIYGGQVIYEQRTNSSQGRSMEVYTLSGDGAGPEEEIAPTQVYSATGLPVNESRSIGYSSMVPSWYPGEGAFAYVEGGSLYARDYEGGREVKLEASVLQLIAPDNYVNDSYFR
jgi:hypothetical protein